jgi:hypothetical protein
VTSKLNYGRKTLSDRLMEVCQCFGVISRRMREIWGTKVPVKVRIFTWQCCFMLNCRQRYRSKKKKLEGRYQVSAVWSKGRYESYYVQMCEYSSSQKKKRCVNIVDSFGRL